MGAALSPEARRLVDERNVAHLSTLMPGGEPKVEPVWIGREGDLVFVTTDVKSIKAKNLARDPRMALSVTGANPYEQLLIRGRLVETRPDDDLAAMDQLSLKYLGRPFPRRRWSGRVALVFEASIARYYQSPLADLVVDPID